jgi:3-hydroxyisobutyrate dehydrogenase-like beta-hydroxyacid dehydrogenase
MPDHVLTRTFDYNFSLGLLLKDIDTAMQMTQEAGNTTPMLRLAREMIKLSSAELGTYGKMK